MKTDGDFNIIECKCPKCKYYNKIELSVLLELGTKRGQKQFRDIVAVAT